MPSFINTKKNAYRQGGVTNFHNKTTGFFTPYRTFAEFGSELKAPVAMPIICLVSALHQAVDLLAKLSLAALNLVVLDRNQAKKILLERAEKREPIIGNEELEKITPGYQGVAGHLGYAIGFVFSAIIDTIRVALSLVTRTGSTLIVAPITLIANCLPSSNASAP